MRRENNCEYRRIRKNYNFGKKSDPTMVCRDCGNIIKKAELSKQKKERDKRKKWRKK